MFACDKFNDFCYTLWNEFRTSVSLYLTQNFCNTFYFRHRYSRRILIGLIFCCIGDACLVFSEYFEIGMIAFGIGHIYYILAFGFKPLNLPLGIFLHVLNAAGKNFLL